MKWTVKLIVPAVPSSTGVADVFAANADGNVQAIRADGGTGSIRVEIYSKRSHERVSPMLSMHGDVGLEEAKHAIWSIETD